MVDIIFHMTLQFHIIPLPSKQKSKRSKDSYTEIEKENYRNNSNSLNKTNNSNTRKSISNIPQFWKKSSRFLIKLNETDKNRWQIQD